MIDLDRIPTTGECPVCQSPVVELVVTKREDGVAHSSHLKFFCSNCSNTLIPIKRKAKK